MKLARWTLTIDKKYHIKSFFQHLVIFTMVFVFFTSIDVRWDEKDENYVFCAILTIVAFVVTLVLGSSFMFYSMSGKHDMQRLLMLPASNLEKYLMALCLVDHPAAHSVGGLLQCRLVTVCVWSGGWPRTGKTGDQCRHRVLPERYASVLPHDVCVALRLAAFALCRRGNLLPLPQEQLDCDDSGAHRGQPVAFCHSRPVVVCQYVLVE